MSEVVTSMTVGTAELDEVDWCCWIPRLLAALLDARRRTSRTTIMLMIRTATGTTARSVIMLMVYATRVLNRRLQAKSIAAVISATSVRATTTFLVLLVVHSTCACSHSSFHSSIQTKPTTVRLSKLMLMLVITTAQCQY